MYDIDKLLNHITENQEEIIASIDKDNTSVNRCEDYIDCELIDSKEITEDDVDAKLDELVEEGQILRTVNSKGDIMYSANPDYNGPFEDLIE